MKTEIANRSLVRTLLAGFLAVSPLAHPRVGLAQAEDPDAAPGGAVEETDFSPKKYSATRYLPTYTNSPFEREILPEVVVGEDKPPPTPFDLKIVGVSRIGERYRVTLVDKKGEYVAVTEQPDKKTGYHFTEIEPAARIQDYRVKIEKDGQSEWAEFDTKRFSLASKAAPAPAPAANSRERGGRPAVVPTRPGGAPGRTTPNTIPAPSTPRGRDVNRRSGQAATDAINRANAAAVESQSKSRVPTRKVVLPPPGR